MDSGSVMVSQLARGIQARELGQFRPPPFGQRGTLQQNDWVASEDRKQQVALHP